MSDPSDCQWFSAPSSQLKVVRDYFQYLSHWDLDKLSTLTSPGFIQETLPASMGVPTRTKTEDLAFLKDFRDSLNGSPLEVCP
jgi:hypothetical protein